MERRSQRRCLLAYANNYLINLKAAIIVDVEATRAIRQAEVVGAARTMIELKPRCCPKMPARKVPRSIHEQARDVARDIAKTHAYVRSPRERKKIKMLFAHPKCTSIASS